MASRFCSFCAAVALVWLLPGTRVLAAPILLGVDVQFGTLLRLDTSSGHGTPIGHVSDTAAGLAFDSSHGILYASSTTSKNLVRVDPATGAVTTVGPMGVSLMHALEYDPLNDTLYGSTTSSANLYRISVETGEATLIGHHGISGLAGLAFDPVNGVMYGGDATGKSLYTLNLSTGVPTLIGRFGTGHQVGVGLAYDPQLGLFAVDNNGGSDLTLSDLYQINTSTGVATLIGSTGAQNVISMAFIPEPSSVVAALASALLIVHRRSGR